MRKRAGKFVLIIATLLAVAVPAWGAALTQTLHGGDTLAVKCDGVRLDQVRNNATNRTLTCVPNPTTSSTTSTTSPTTTTTPTTTNTSTSTTSSTSTTTPTTTIAPTTTLPASGVLYSNTFDNAGDINRLRFQKIGNTSNTTFNGDHDNACGNPFTYRPLSDNNTVAPNAPGSLVYWCNGHFMTAVDTTAYMVIAMTPTNAGQTIIFPGNANRFCWNQDLAEHGGRKWVEVAVVSDDRFNANGGGLGYWNPDFNGNQAAGSILLSGDDFMFQYLEVQYFVGQNKTYSDFTNNTHSFTDKAGRFQHCLVDNGNGTITFSAAMLNGTVFSRTGPGSFPAGPRVFILMDVSYDPRKDESAKVAEPSSIHWDNITVTSGTAVPAAPAA